jgi:cytosine/adenosine deaminase-related metal-dependent hydrolase
MNPLLIKNGLLVTVNPNSDFFLGDILIENGKISKIEENIQIDNVEIFDASDYIVTPGFIQTHVHLCQALFRNLADDLSLLDWLEKKIWPMEGKHTPHSLRLSAQMGISELLLGGTSTILDMGTVHHMDVVFEEIEKSGIRAFCGKTMMDADNTIESLKESTKQAIKTSCELLEKWHNSASGRIKYAFAPRFALSCTKDLMIEVKDLADQYKVLYHTHASENQDETKIVQEKFGKRNIEYFEELGITKPNLCVAHCIWLDEHEKQLLQDNQVKVLHCPSANLKLGSGIAPIPEYIDRGINVSIGADGAPCNNNMNIFTEMRHAALIQKPVKGPKSMPAETAFKMATIEGAKALGLDQEIGSLEIGKKADICFIKRNQVQSLPFENIYSKIVYSTQSDAVEYLMIDGKWVVTNQQLQNYDISLILSEINELNQY